MSVFPKFKTYVRSSERNTAEISVPLLIFGISDI